MYEITRENATRAFRNILDQERPTSLDRIDDRYVVGLDLGQSHDFTAASIIKKHTNRLQVVHLERYPLGTTYPGVVLRLKSLFSSPRLRGKTA